MEKLLLKKLLPQQQQQQLPMMLLLLLATTIIFFAIMMMIQTSNNSYYFHRQQQLPLLRQQMQWNEFNTPPPPGVVVLQQQQLATTTEKKIETTTTISSNHNNNNHHQQQKPNLVRQQRQQQQRSLTPEELNEWMTTMSNTTRFMRGVPKSGTTFVHFLVTAAIRAWIEGTHETQTLNWWRFPDHSTMYDGKDVFPNQVALHEARVIPAFGHGANCGRDDCNGTKPEDLVFRIVRPDQKVLFLIRHPLSLAWAQHRWYEGTNNNNNNYSAEELRDNVSCILRHFSGYLREAQAHPTQVMVVRYEDLVIPSSSSSKEDTTTTTTTTTASKTLQSILDFYGLPWTTQSIRSALFNARRDKMRQLEDELSETAEKKLSERYHYVHNQSSTAKLVLNNNNNYYFYPETTIDELRRNLKASGFDHPKWNYSIDYQREY
mmetsp:Transcript_30342/g.45951  ORF Transcript_30342/g.45951 Transcript_30342/m.45951 type:complete len:433 (-) Transcript_30342:658-1956(-)